VIGSAVLRRDTSLFFNFCSPARKRLMAITVATKAVAPTTSQASFGRGKRAGRKFTVVRATAAEPMM
jgi:hypothetical protein